MHLSISETDECKIRNHLLNNPLTAVWDKDEDDTSNAIVVMNIILNIIIIVIVIVIAHQIESLPKYNQSKFRTRATFYFLKLMIILALLLRITNYIFPL